MESLADKLVTYISIRRGISKPQAAKFIDACLESVSVELNTSYNRVYQTFYTFAALSTCLAKSCSSADLQECKKLCHCVEYKGKCTPRYIPEAIEINNDPDKWIIGVPTNKLQDFAEYASYLYYNFDGGGLTDNAFDAIEYHLNKRLKQKGRRWEKIGAEPIEKLRTTLPYPMMSLTKVKPGEPALSSFIQKAAANGMTWSDKLDGVSGLVVYRAGVIESVFTRGNGTIGGNVTFLKDYITFPKVSYNYFVVRGEFILSKRMWEEKYKGSGYANARSFVSAKINSGFASPALPDIQFLAYQVVDWTQKGIPPPSQGFKILTEQGFQTPNNGLFPAGKDLLLFDLVSLYQEEREASEYTIDGLVLSLDIPQPLDQLTNPEYSKAFKMTLEEQLRDTRVVNVDWNITRHGRYFPVAVFESVYIDGVRLHRASAHNAGHVISWKLGKGVRITVARSGDVIPTIKDVQVDPTQSPILPGDEYPWHWSDNSKDIILDDIENNPMVQIKRITHFFSTIQTPQLGEGRITKLYQAGFKTIKDFTTAKQSDIIKIKGFGPKLSKTLYENIHNTMRQTRMDRYFIAITTFKTQIGRALFKQVIRYYPQILTASSQEIIEYLKKHKIPGIGPKRRDVLAESIPEFRETLMDLNKDDIAYAIKYQEEQLENLKQSGYNLKIKGKLFVTTGFLDHPDYELEDYIWDHWGEVSSSVTSGTTAVIAASASNVTGKMLKAHELGVPVYTVKEFIKYFDLPIKAKDQADLIITDVTPTPSYH